MRRSLMRQIPGILSSLVYGLCRSLRWMVLKHATMETVSFLSLLCVSGEAGGTQQRICANSSEISMEGSVYKEGCKISLCFYYMSI